MSLTSGFQCNSVFRASLLVIKHSFFLLFFALLIFLFISAILASMHLDLFRGSSLKGALRIGSLGTHCSINSSLASDFASFSVILSASLFILLIFCLLNLALVLSDALVILSFKVSIWDFRLLISASRLLNFLVSLESLFRLHLSCLLVKGASSNLGCLASVCGSLCGSQVDICGGPPRGTPLHGGGGGGLFE